MKKLLKLIYVLTLTIIIGSCTNAENEEGIYGGGEDKIKLSRNHVEFDSKQNSITITTEGKGWWVSEVSVNGEEFSPTGINLQSKSYVFAQDCFLVEKIDDYTINIEIDENLTTLERTIVVLFTYGNFHDTFVIKQSAD